MSRSIAELLFHPQSIVVYGASSDPEKLSGRPLDYLKKFGFAGTLWAVNPRRSEVQGVTAHADIAQVPGPIDLAIVVVPAESVVDAVSRCARAGVGAAIVFASGFAEAGDAGIPMQETLTQISRESGMRILGPNCLGSFSAADKAFATFSTAFDEDDERPDSPIVLASQSGAVGTFTYSSMNAIGLGVRYFANTGNQSDLTIVEVLGSVVDSPDVELLMGHMEGAGDLGALSALARAADTQGKPLLLLKTGRTPAGARAVAAHTASVAGDDAAFDAALAHHRVIRVDSMEAWADTALAFIGGRRAGGSRISIVTLSGGAGAIAADCAVELGLSVDTWTDTVARVDLAAQLPTFASVANPIDVTGSMINDVSLLERSLASVCANDETDCVLVVLGNADRSGAEIVATLIEAQRATDKPFFVSWTGGSGRPRQALLETGIPCYPDPNRALRALRRVVDYGLSTRVAESLVSG